MIDTSGSIKTFIMPLNPSSQKTHLTKGLQAGLRVIYGSESPESQIIRTACWSPHKYFECRSAPTEWFLQSPRNHGGGHWWFVHLCLFMLPRLSVFTWRDFSSHTVGWHSGEKPTPMFSATGPRATRTALIPFRFNWPWRRSMDGQALRGSRHSDRLGFLQCEGRWSRCAIFRVKRYCGRFRFPQINGEIAGHSSSENGSPEHNIEMPGVTLAPTN